MRKHHRKEKYHVKSGSTKKYIFYLSLFVSAVLVIKTIHLLGVVVQAINSKDKIVLAVRQSNDDVHIHIIEPNNRSYHLLKIPSQTLVNSSHGLGDWRIGSLWKQGINDKVGGEYLRKSIVREFNIPVLNWADSTAEQYFDKSFLGNIRLLGTHFLTDLSYGDRLVLFYYSTQISNSERSVNDLSDTSFIDPAKLPDGEEGYVVNDAFPQFLLPVFSQDKVSNSKIKIVNHGLNEAEVRNVAKTFEVMGGKVAFIERGQFEESVCRIGGVDKEIVGKIAKLYTCEIDTEKNPGGFDLVLTVGKKFTSLN
jgi:hypothetical protein